MVSINKSKGQDRVSQTWDGFVSATDHKSVKKYTREIAKAYGNEVVDETDEFMRDFRGGKR